MRGRRYFYLEKVLWRAVDFLKGLLAGVGHGLHGGGGERASAVGNEGQAG
jgi:hypothetical protein